MVFVPRPRRWTPRRRHCPSGRLNRLRRRTSDRDGEASAGRPLCVDASHIGYWSRRMRRVQCSSNGRRRAMTGYQDRWTECTDDEIRIRAYFPVGDETHPLHRHPVVAAGPALRPAGGGAHLGNGEPSLLGQPRSAATREECRSHPGPGAIRPSLHHPGRLRRRRGDRLVPRAPRNRHGGERTRTARIGTTAWAGPHRRASRPSSEKR